MTSVSVSTIQISCITSICQPSTCRANAHHSRFLSERITNASNDWHFIEVIANKTSCLQMAKQSMHHVETDLNFTFMGHTPVACYSVSVADTICLSVATCINSPVHKYVVPPYMHQCINLLYHLLEGMSVFILLLSLQSISR